MTSRGEHRHFGRGRAASGARSRRILLHLLVAIGLAACGQPTARLLELTRITRSDDGRTLAVEGRGFPVGRTGQAVLDGTLFRTGQEPAEVHLTLTCRALGAELLEVEVSPRAKLGRGTFQGRLEIRFASSAGSGEVTGALEAVRVRLPASDDALLAEGLDLARRARAFQREIGAIELEPSPRGLVVKRVQPGSVLARLGVEPRDTIERIDGAPVERPPELVPVAGREVHTVTLIRRQTGQRETVTVGRDGRVPGPTRLAWAAFLLGGLAGLFIPVAARRNAHGAAMPAMETGLALALTLASFAVFGLPGATLHAAWFVGLPVLTQACLALMAYAKRKLSSTDASRACAAASARALAVCGLGSLAGTLSQPWALGSMLAWPNRWPLLIAPPAWLCFLVLKLARPPSAPSGPARIVDTWLDLSLAGAAVSLAAGAGMLPPGVGASSPIWLSAAVLATKTSAAFALWKLPSRPLPAPWIGALGLGCPAFALAWLALAPATAATLPLGCLLAGVGLCLQTRRLVGFPALPTRDPALAPFS